VDEELQAAPGWVVDEHDAPEETRGSRAGRVEASWSVGEWRDSDPWLARRSPAWSSVEKPPTKRSSRNGRLLELDGIGRLALESAPVESLDGLTNRKYNRGMILELLAHKDYLRILIALEDAPRRFSELQQALDLNPAQVDRGLKFLRKGLWIVPRTLPAERGPIRVEYELGKRGKAFLRSFERFRADVQRQAPQIGPTEVEELQRLSV